MKVRKESVETDAWTKFRLLMWKNFLQQWRHQTQTIVELFLPVVTMTLVLILRQQIEPYKQNTTTYPSLPAYTLNYSIPVFLGLNLSQLSIAYSPRSPVIDDIVRSAMVNLFARNLKDLTAIISKHQTQMPDILKGIPLDLDNIFMYEYAKTQVKVRPFENSSQMRAVYSDEQEIRNVITAIEFDDELLDTTQLTSSISYVLRFPERPRLNSFFGLGGRSWRTDHTFPFFEHPGPRFPYSWEGGNDPGYVNEMFIAIQHALAMALISKVTGKNLRHFKVNIQRYPHPPFVEDYAIEAIMMIFPLFVLLSFSYTAANIVRVITVEKELQLKETMKIMGLPTWLHWTSWFCKQFIYMLISAVLIVAIVKINWFTNEQGYSDYAVFTNTSWTVLLFYMTLYLSCAIFFCFMISGFFHKASTAALFGGVIWFLSYVPAVLMGMTADTPVVVQALSCFSVNTAMSFGFQLILSKENIKGMQWGEFFATHSLEKKQLLFGHICIFLIMDSMLYMLVALYLEQVLPGPFGAPKPWHFPFQKSFWFPTSRTIYDDTIFSSYDDDNLVKEDDPTNLEVGVKMLNLTKVYGNDIVVNNVNLNIFDDQITVLLGHNGAGKSTTISMLTGNVEVTRGSVWVAGYNVTTQTSQARTQIGLCLQHNVLFNELTVQEHLEFFARLKGYKGQELNEEIFELIDRLDMQEKRHYMAEGLSGGQKRRLCVGVALSGGARVVLLDEPTSGMDPASRRALWNLLQIEKKGRSLILTTHFMDEADYLGDRVAIMSNGRIQCVGSPYFLKQYYGVGYTLVIVKYDDFKSDYCTALIGRYIPGTVIKDDREMEVTYNLPNEYSYIFEKMLNDLEKNANNIQFKNYGLISTTLEDVFMSVGSDIEINPEPDDITDIADVSDNLNLSLQYLNRSDESEIGLRLLWLQLSGVWLKLFLIWTRSWGLLALQGLVPILQINLNLGVLQYLFSIRPLVIQRPLTLTKGYRNTETLLYYNGTKPSTLGSLAKDSYEAFFNSANLYSMKLTVIDQDMQDYYLEKTQDPIVLSVIRKEILIGATFDDNTATAWFSNFGYHDVATSLAAVHNAILKAFEPSASLAVFNHPLEANYKDNTDLQTMTSIMSMQVASSIGNSLAIVSAVFIMFYIKERVINTKLLQRAAGMPPAVMWGAAAVFDWLWFILLNITILISCTAFEIIGLSNSTELGRLYLCIIVYGAAMLPLHYLCSLLFKGPAIGFVVMFFVNVIFGLIGAQIVDVLASPSLNTKATADFLDRILQFFPLYSLIMSTKIMNQIGLQIYNCFEHCDYLLAVFANIEECTMKALCKHFTSCCIRDNPFFYWEEPGILRYIISSLVSCVTFWILLMIIEHNWISRLMTREKKSPPLDESMIDPDVADEAEYAERVDITSPDMALVSRGLTKYYKNYLAVDQISFTVSEAEIFGLLGVNGAGKTTTFKMLMADETISSGDAFVSGFSVRKDISNVHKKIGYCPQFEAVFEELTGRETLHLFSRFRGLKYSNVQGVRAEILANALGFTKHLDKRVNEYSGGNKRKLSTAVAMLGRTRLVFVDEPTTGVDPAAKRQVWRAMRAARRAGRAFVLTSHSMEECEALCSRLTIMVNGRFQCMGSPQHLKNKFSEGFTLTIKVKTSEDPLKRSKGSTNKIETIKKYVSSHYNNVKLKRCKEEYQGVLTYYLPDRSMTWSKMFGIMEKGKRKLDVEDYRILQTTLEQIFLQFTKYQRDTSR